VDSHQMRLWTLHPQYLDPKGLVAAWREALLAQRVLAGATRGYRNHPQLIRFQAQPDSLAAIAAFLTGLAEEANRRGYHFDVSKILHRATKERISETRGQLLFEWKHLQKKLHVRAPLAARKLRKITVPKPHPLFSVIPGNTRSWEKR
jgi:hypothetical protein